MTLPPYARALDVRAARAAFAAGTLSTVRDHAATENEKRLVETSDADGYDLDVMHAAEAFLPSIVLDAACREGLRQSRLRLWQAQR